MRNSLIYIALVVLGIACENNQKNKCAFIPNTKETKISFTYQSLESELAHIKSKTQLESFLDKHPILADNFFYRNQFPSNSVFIEELYHRFTNIYIDTLFMEVKKTFGDGQELKTRFENAFKNVKYYFSTFQPPVVQTIISGLETDMYVSDTVVVIGLDFYIGSEARFKPNMYSYMQRRYNKDFIVPSVLLLMGIDSRLNKIDPNDKTVLAEMIAYGKAYYFAKQMIPCTADSIFIGYTAEEINGAKEYESLIWSRLIEDQVLFSTSHLVKQKYLEERPKTLEIGDKCPGRIGTWVGWQIVKKYMDNHPDVTLSQLMAMSNSSLIFSDSQYKPQFIPLAKK